METLKNAFYILYRRPLVLLLYFITILLLWLLIRPFISVILGFATFGDGNAIWGLVSLLQLCMGFLSDPKVILTGFILLAGVILASALLIGLLISGCSNVFKNILEGKPKYSGDFIFGIKKYFLRIFLITVRVLLFSFILTVFIAVASVPAVVVTRMAVSGKQEFIILSILLDMVTGIVLFTALVFFRIYMSFWYPAASACDKKCFKMARKTADTHFGKTAFNFICFDGIFVVLMILLNYTFVLRLNFKLLSGQINNIVNLLFLTFFFSLFTAYVFSAFKASRDGS